MAWIRTVPFEDAAGKLRKLYERVTGPGNNVDKMLYAIDHTLTVRQGVQHGESIFIPQDQL